MVVKRMSVEKDYGNVLREEEVHEIVKRSLEGELLSYSIRPVSDNPVGFLGEHYKLEAEVGVRNATKKLKYFVKRLPSSVPEHREYALKTGAFYKEVEMYKTLFADLKKAQRNPTKWCPDYFYSRDSELFVLEDLSTEGYYMYPERSFLDEEHLKVSMQAMAAMHAASVVFEEKFNRGEVDTAAQGYQRVAGRKTTLGEIYARLTFETEASDVKGHPGNAYHEAGILAQLKIVELLPGYSAEEKRKIQEKLPDVLRRSFQLVKTSDRFRNVFLHGDLWANNILFRKGETGKVKDAIIIDFQLARYAPPAHDVMMFLHFVQSKKFLEKRQGPLLELYYESFAEELKKNSLEAEMLLPWDVFMESCRFYDDLGLIAKIFYFQMILTPPEIMGKYLSSPELYTRNMLVDRSEMVVESFLEDEIYRSRVTEAMTDVIKRFIHT